MNTLQWAYPLGHLVAVCQVRLSFDEKEGGGPPPDDEAGWHLMHDSQELDLQQRLVEDFVTVEYPSVHDEVRRCFSRRGAWRAFKDLLSRRRLLDQWHHFEGAAKRRTLLAWGADQGIEVVDAPPDNELLRANG